MCTSDLVCFYSSPLSLRATTGSLSPSSGSTRPPRRFPRPEPSPPEADFPAAAAEAEGSRATRAHPVATPSA